MMSSQPPSPVPSGCTSPNLTNSATPASNLVAKRECISPTPQNNNNNNNNNTSVNNNNTNSSSSSSSNSSSSDNQQFCLRWNNFKSNLQETFEQLLERQLFVDVTLSCEEKSVKAHRIVLSACSPYFQTILKEATCSHPVIILQGVKWRELSAVVDFMYKGEINVSQDQLPGLLKLAETLKVRGLTEVGDGEETEAIITSPSPRARPLYASDELPRKRRRYSGDDILLQTHGRNRSPSPTSFTPPLALMDFLEPEPGFPLINLSRSSASSQHSASSNCNGGINHSSASPSPSMASSLSSLVAHLPSAMPPPPGHHHPMGPLPPHLAHLPPLSPLSPLLGMHHPMNRHHQTAPDDFEIRPGIAEMIREEERVRMQEIHARLQLLPPLPPPPPDHLAISKAKLLESSHHWIGNSMADTYQAQVQAAWQKSWNQTQSLLQNLRFRERGPLKSWRPETMADAIHAVLKEGLSLSQAARKYDIPYPTFVLYANRVHNLLGPSAEPGDLRPKGRGRPQRILLGSWPEDQIKLVIRAVVFRDTSVFKDQEHKARMEKQNAKQALIKAEAASPNSNGSASSTNPAGLQGLFKPGTPIAANTPDSNRSASTPSTSHGPVPQGRGSAPPGVGGPGPPLAHTPRLDHSPHMALPKPPQLGGPNLGLSDLGHFPGSLSDNVGGETPTQQHPASTSAMHNSPQQSPAVSTPLPPPLSSPATPDTALSLPPPSPSIVTPSPVGGTIPSASDSPPVTSSSSPPRQSPPVISPPRRCPPPQVGIPPSFKGMYHHSGNGPMINGNSPNSNGPMMSQAALPFQQHLLQQQMMGGLMQGALPPNMPPPPNHARMPPLPHNAYPGYLRPPVPQHAGPPRSMVPEESPEAMLFNKLVGAGQFPPMKGQFPPMKGQFPPMNPRPYFQQDPSSQDARNAQMMFHRDPSLDRIKSEPEPILN